MRRGSAVEAADSGPAAAGPRDAGWFGSFDQQESTFSEDGLDADVANPERSVKGGWGAGYEHPGGPRSRPDEWFDESGSGGSRAAWQTHFPAVGSTAEWQRTPEGWAQDYRPASPGNSGGPNSAEWFDVSVASLDRFGRQVQPQRGTGRWYTSEEGWQQRAVNTTIGCASVGCTATARLRAFDRTTEEAGNCRLNIAVHATDYDNEWAKETIENWLVNGYLAKADCDPRAMGCNATAWRPLYNCLDDFQVDHIIDANGTLEVQGKITKFVDECPYNGNLLDGVVTVTCMVRPLRPPENRTSPATAAALRLAAPTTPAPPVHVTAEVPLRCSKPGCTATALLNIDPQVAMAGGSCSLNVTVVQTDFDDHLGVPEQIDFIALDGVGNLTANVEPGLNPCTARYQGRPVTAEQMVFTALSGYNVTAQVLKQPMGSLSFTAKISENVDECASNGYLLDALAKVTCIKV